MSRIYTDVIDTCSACGWFDPNLGCDGGCGNPDGPGELGNAYMDEIPDDCPLEEVDV